VFGDSVAAIVAEEPPETIGHVGAVDEVSGVAICSSVEGLKNWPVSSAAAYLARSVTVEATLPAAARTPIRSWVVRRPPVSVYAVAKVAGSAVGSSTTVRVMPSGLKMRAVRKSRYGGATSSEKRRASHASASSRSIIATPSSNFLRTDCAVSVRDDQSIIMICVRAELRG